jgi:hypothetical protein
LLPPEAIADFSSVLTGDGTPESYLSASIFCRDVQDLGIIWHGHSWSEHEILFEKPFDQPKYQYHFRPPEEGDWQWRGPEPKIWMPCFQVYRGRPRITFHTYSAMDQRALYRHVDLYEKGSYASKSDTKVLFEGGSGYIH